MDETTAACYLALRHSGTLSAGDFARRIKRHGTIKALLASKDGERLNEVVTNPDKQSRQAIDAEREWATRTNCHLLLYEDDNYPSLLKETASPPPVLTIVGNPDLTTAQIGIVGSRNCSHYGKRSAHWLSAELAKLGLTITSGLALGIDSAAHDGALSAVASAAPTIAVIANGQDRIYPKQNGPLAERIAERGSLVSEFPLGTPPLAGNFPQRNRIISGLSQGVVVVEAAMRSGSLITARQATEQNRELFAIPGPINRSQSEGCHWLISNGAKLVSKPGDILAELSEETLEGLRRYNCSNRSSGQKSAPDTEIPITDKECRSVLAILQGESMLFDELLAQSRMSTESLTASLLQLQILGRIEMRAGRIQCLV